MSLRRAALVSLLFVTGGILLYHLSLDLLLDDCGLQKDRAWYLAKQHIQAKRWPMGYLKYMDSRGTCWHRFQYLSMERKLDFAVFTTWYQAARITEIE
tara:strand:- start:1241 stop:1534 length:294 start_codon:yes stop_codon:yes gene_type:complete